MKRIGVMLAAALLAACAGPQVKNAGTVIEREMKDGKVVSETEQRSPYSEYLNKVTEKSYFEMTCPASGCVFASLKVPIGGSGNGGNIAAPQPELTAGVAFVQGAFDFGKAILNTGVAIAPWIGVSRIALGALARPSDASYHVTTTDTSNRSTTATTTNTTTTNVTASGQGSGAVAGGGTATGNSPVSTVTNSNNTTRTTTGGCTTATTGCPTTGGP